METKHWQLSLVLSWKPKPIETTKCPMCLGRGSTGGGFKDLDDPVTCTRCFGDGFVATEAREPQPPLPEDLIDQLREVWNKWNK